LPGLIDLYDAHTKDRDKFEILAFHDGTVKTFAELDEKIVPARKRYWGGRDLPFPILLDATGETIKTFDIHAFPTTILIDPEGKLVGHAGEEQLEAKLPPLPMSVRIARALDRNVRPFRLEGKTLEGAVHFLSRLSHVPIRLDQDSLKAAGVASNAQLPLEMTASITLRSVLNLLLEADGLTYEQDDKGLVIRARKPGESPPQRLSEPQRAIVKRIEKALDQKMSFDFKDKTLEEVARFFDNHTDETFVLDPRDRRAGRLDPKTQVNGSAKDIPLREALQKLLEPIGAYYTIRDEVIVFSVKPKAAAGK
jgi:hypothetical protein